MRRGPSYTPHWYKFKIRFTGEKNLTDRKEAPTRIWVLIPQRVGSNRQTALLDAPQKCSNRWLPCFHNTLPMQKEEGYESSDWLPPYKGKIFQVQPLVLDCFWRAQSGMLRWLSAKLLTRVRKWAFTTMLDLSLLGVLTFAVVLLKRVIIHMVMRIIIYTKDNTQSYSKITSSLSLEVVQLGLGGHLSTIWGEDSSTGLKVTEITCRFPLNSEFLSVYEWLDLVAWIQTFLLA